MKQKMEEDNKEKRKGGREKRTRPKMMGKEKKDKGGIRKGKKIIKVGMPLDPPTLCKSHVPVA